MSNGTVSCEVATAFANYAPIKAVEWMQALPSTASIILVALTMRTYLRRNIFEGTFKEIIVAIFITILVHDAVTATVQFAHIFSGLFKSPCEAPIDKRFCILRSVAVAVFTLIPWLHSCITVQRIVTSFPSPPWAHQWVGRVCMAVSVTYSGVFTFVSLDPIAFKGTTMYCTGVTSANIGIMSGNQTLMAVLDGVSLVVDIALLKYNQRKIQRAHGNLAQTFRRKQNIYSMQQFIPVAMLHTVCYGIQYCGYMYAYAIFNSLVPPESTAIIGFMNLVPWYCALFPIILHIQMRQRLRKGRTHTANMVNQEMTEHHFHGLAALWGDKGRGATAHTPKPPPIQERQRAYQEMAL